MARSELLARVAALESLAGERRRPLPQCACSPLAQTCPQCADYWAEVLGRLDCAALLKPKGGGVLES